MDLISMKLTPEEQKHEAMETMMASKPEYPYGLRIDLCDESVEKLGIEKLPEIGSTMLVMAKCEVCCVSERKDEDGETDKQIGLQIVEMSVGQKKSAQKALYGED